MKLLLAEDEPDLNEALVAIFEHNGYTVDSVLDGRDALDYLMASEYDGAVLDIMMPKLDGISVLKSLRESGSRIPVLLLTAKAEVDDRVRGLDCGADDYLPKPFATKELLARVRAMLRRKEDLTDSVLSLGNLSLDRGSFELTVGEKSQRLGNKEFQMLELLMAHPNRLYSTEYFMENIWGYDSDSDIHAVWTCLSTLRKKLEKLGARVDIKAKRGQGYYLEVQDG